MNPFFLNRGQGFLKAGIQVIPKFLKLIIFLLPSIIWSCNPNPEQGVTVMNGPFRQSITESGELEAVRAVAITMPNIGWQYGSRHKIMAVVDNGSMVKEGDTLIKLDPSSIEKFIITQEEALESEMAAAKKQTVQMENNMQELQAQLRSEEASFNLKKLELERSRFESEKTRRIKELEFQQSEIRMGKLTRQLRVKPQLDNYDMIVQNIKVKQKEEDVEKARKTLGQMVILSPNDGLFQVGRSMFNYSQNLKVGDEVYMGSMIARIPDIRKMKVRCVVDEADFRKVAVGTQVIVRLDAMPTIPFQARVTEVSRICTEIDKRKVFKTVIEVDSTDLRLKPGMTVSCEYLCYTEEDALYVPNSCILKEYGKTYVFLDKGKTPKKTEVKTGASNSNHTIVSGDVKTGQKLVPVEMINSEKTI